MTEERSHVAGWVGLLIALVVLLPSGIAVWVDEAGHTYLTNQPGPPAEYAIRVSPEDLSIQWKGELLGPLVRGDSDSSREEDRYLRSVMSARDDVSRGELKRGLRVLRGLHAANPGRPEAALLLAMVERRRGRLEPAAGALEGVLAVRHRLPREWREAAERLDRELREEIELAAATDGGVWASKQLQTDHFQIAYDHQFAGREYGRRVGDLLEQVRNRLHRALDRTLDRPLEVRLYTKRHYLDAYKHRFGFATVGFYDGAIHVVSTKRPQRDLYALLIHEYSHALFEDALGSHQPFFLNEGIADREEEIARGRPRISRGEWRRLLDADRAGEWIPLASLVRGFGGLKGRRALLAYLESRAAIQQIHDKDPAAIGRWIERTSQGEPWESALRAETGWDTASLEAALIADLRSRFPDPPEGIAFSARSPR